MSSNPQPESPFACVMDAIDAEMRAPHLENARQLFAAVTEVRELQNGFAFRLPASLLERAAKFVSLEKLCCPFFGFLLEVEREGGDLWLLLTGREGVKMFIQAEISEIVGTKALFSIRVNGSE